MCICPLRFTSADWLYFSPSTYFCHSTTCKTLRKSGVAQGLVQRVEETDKCWNSKFEEQYEEYPLLGETSAPTHTVGVFLESPWGGTSIRLTLLSLLFSTPLPALGRRSDTCPTGVSTWPVLAFSRLDLPLAQSSCPAWSPSWNTALLWFWLHWEGAGYW